MSASETVVGFTKRLETLRSGWTNSSAVDPKVEKKQKAIQFSRLREYISQFIHFSSSLDLLARLEKRFKNTIADFFTRYSSG